MKEEEQRVLSLSSFRPPLRLSGNPRGSGAFFFGVGGTAWRGVVRADEAHANTASCGRVAREPAHHLL